MKSISYEHNDVYNVLISFREDCTKEDVKIEILKEEESFNNFIKYNLNFYKFNENISIFDNKEIVNYLTDIIIKEIFLNEKYGCSQKLGNWIVISHQFTSQSSIISQKFLTHIKIDSEKFKVN